MRRIALLGVVMVLFIAGVAPRADAEAQPIGSFETIYSVLLSPRCKNCHPAGDAPLQGDGSRPHAMNISRTSAESGLACTTCHGTKNADFPHGPPGRPGWRLPPPEMPLVFEGRGAHDLCEQLKDPARNGGKTLAELEHHLDQDPFVLWAWQPGPGRTVPPQTHAETMKAVHEWVKAKGPCP